MWNFTIRMNAEHLSMNYRILEWFGLEGGTSKNKLVHSPRCGPEHLSLGQVAQIPIQEQPMYTSFEPWFNMKTGCLSQRWFQWCAEFVFTLSFSTEITQQLSPKMRFYHLSLYSGYYPIPLSAKSQCLKEKKVEFWTGVARHTKESLTGQHISHQPKHVGGKQTSGTNHEDSTMNICKILTPLRGKKLIIVSLFNYDLFSSLHYRYESMLPHLHLLSLTCTIT